MIEIIELGHESIRDDQIRNVTEWKKKFSIYLCNSYCSSETNNVLIETI